MPRYKNSVRNYVLDNVDLIDLISSRVKLERAGAIMKGLCPFHNEKTPSFVVSNDRGAYHCFGCNVHGNAIDFVMQTDNLSFIEALEYLADRFHLDLSPYIEENSDYRTQSFDKIYEMNIEAAKFFRDQLLSTQRAMKYFTGRGLKKNTIMIFGLGYAPDSWDSLTKHLKSRGYSEEDIKKSGLATVSSNGSLIDRFRNRVMFPIIDYRNKVLGFGGRTMGDEKPKYLNSAEGPVFKKSEILYGDRLSRRAKRQDGVILVEGYMDMIQVYQSGFHHVLASMGTALTDSQAKKISQRYKIVFFAYDMDNAGRNAISRSIPVLENVGVEVRIIELEKAKDPDEFLKRFGASIFKSKIESSLNVIQYRLREIKDKYDLTDAQERLDYLEQSMGLISTINQPIEAEVYIQELAAITGIAYETLNTEYKRRSINLSTTTGFNSENRNFSKIETEEKNKREESIDLIKNIDTELLKIALSDKDYAFIIDSEIEKFSDDEIGEIFAALMVYYVSMDFYDPITAAQVLGYDISLAIEKFATKNSFKCTEDSLRILLKRRDLALVNREIKRIDERIERLIYADDDVSKTKLRELRKEKRDLMVEAYNKKFNSGKKDEF